MGYFRFSLIGLKRTGLKGNNQVKDSYFMASGPKDLAMEGVWAILSLRARVHVPRVPWTGSKKGFNLKFLKGYHEGLGYVLREGLLGGQSIYYLGTTWRLRLKHALAKAPP